MAEVTKKVEVIDWLSVKNSAVKFAGADTVYKLTEAVVNAYKEVKGMKGAKVEVSINGDTVTFLKSDKVSTSKTEATPEAPKAAPSNPANVRKLTAISVDKKFYRLEGFNGWFALASDVEAYVTATPAVVAGVMVEATVVDAGGENPTITSLKLVNKPVEQEKKAEVAPEKAVPSAQKPQEATKTENTTPSVAKVEKMTKSTQDSIETQCALKAAVDVFVKIAPDAVNEDIAVEMITRLTDKFVTIIRS